MSQAIFTFSAGIVVLFHGYINAIRLRIPSWSILISGLFARACSRMSVSRLFKRKGRTRDETRPSFDPDRSLAKAHYLYKALVYLDESIAYSWCISHRCDPVFVQLQPKSRWYVIASQICPNILRHVALLKNVKRYQRVDKHLWRHIHAKIYFIQLLN